MDVLVVYEKYITELEENPYLKEDILIKQKKTNLKGFIINT